METVIIALAALIVGVLSGFAICLLTFCKPKPQPRKPRAKPGPKPKSGGGPGEGDEGP